MKKTLTIISLLLIIINGNFTVFAQTTTPASENKSRTENVQNKDETKLEDVVYLKNGSIIRGRMLELIPDSLVRIAIVGGSEFVFKASEISKIVAEKISTPHNENQNNSSNIEPPKPTKVEKPKYYRDKGIYTYISGGFLMCITSDEVPDVGIHGDLIIGHQLNRWAAIGGGIGFNRYPLNEWMIVPIYADYRGYTNKSSESAYYSLGLGYGFVATNSSNAEAKGGIFIRPAIGYRFSSVQKTQFLAELGINIQKAKEEETIWDGSTVFRNYTFSRTALRLGILF